MNDEFGKEISDPFKKLSATEEIFLNEYLRGFKVGESAMKAGITKDRAHEWAYRLRKQPHFINALKARLNEIKILHQADVMATIGWLKTAISVDPLDYINEVEGNSVDSTGEIIGKGLYFKKLSDIPKPIRQCIQAIHPTRDGIKVTFVDKLKAAELLGKYFGLYSDEQVANGTIILDQTENYTRLEIGHRRKGEPLEVFSTEEN